MNKQEHLIYTIKRRKECIDDYSNKIVRQAQFLQEKLKEVLAVELTEGFDNYCKAESLVDAIKSSMGWIEQHHREVKKNVDDYRLLSHFVEE